MQPPITPEQFLETIALHYKNLKNLLGYSSHDVFMDAVLKVHDRIVSEGAVFTDEEKLLNYFKLSVLNNNRQDSMKFKKEQGLKRDYNYYASIQETRVVTKEESSNLYDEVFRYVFQKYPFLHAAMFKAYITNSMTYTELALQTGKKRTTTFSIVKKIQADVQQHFKGSLSFEAA